MTVEAKMEQTGKDGSRLYQEMSRKFTLPEDVDVEKLKSLFSAEDCFLTIEAPLKNRPKVEHSQKEIPINRLESDTSNREG